MSVASESVSNSTLVSAVSRLGIDHNHKESTRSDTPLPQDNISDETINLLIAASSKLSKEAPKEQRPKSNKRARRDRSPEQGTSGAPERSDYPPESKPIYLRLKTSYRKKIAIASQITKMHSEMLKKIYPPSVEFKFNINKTRSDKVQVAWSTIIEECKQKLTKTLLDDLFAKYTQVKQSIESDFQQLHEILSISQLQEIKDSLNSRCSKLAPTYTAKAKRQFDKPSGPRGQPKRRKVTPKSNKGGKQDDMQKFMFQLKKLLK